MKTERSSTIWTGLGLIAAGILFGVATFAGWDRVWPLFVLVAGLACWLGYFLGGARDGGLAFLGTGAVLTGVFFLGFSFGVWEWGEMSRLWPVFPLIGGAAFIALFVADRQSRRDLGVLGVGLAAIVIGVIGLLATFGKVPGDIWRYWPVLLILVGLLALVGAFMPRSRRP